MPLDPVAKTFLDEIAAKNAPGWPDLPVNESRQIFEGWKDLFGVGPELAKVEDRITPEGVPIRIYTPPGSHPIGTIVYFHGGGWVLGDVNTHDTLCRHFSFESNCIVISTHYRRAPEHKFPAAFDDSYEATRYAAQRAAEFGVPVQNLVVAGDSAGGNLAAAVCLKARDEQGPKIRLQLLIYPVIDSNINSESYAEFAEGFGLTREAMAWFWLQYLQSHEDGKNPIASPCFARDFSQLPTAHVVLAEYDVLRDEGEKYADSLKQAGVPTTTRMYSGQIHGFVHTSALFDKGRRAITEMAEVIGENLS